MKVSVICPVYNARPELLSQAVQSVLNQQGDVEREIVLVDDGSTASETLDILQTLEQQHAEVKVLRPRSNGGPAKARNLGLRAARFEWVGFIDADDLWPQGKLIRANNLLREQPDVRWIAGNYANLFEDDRLVENAYAMSACKPERLNLDSQTMSTPALTKALIPGWLHLGTSFLKADLVAEAGGFDERAFYGEDWLLFARISRMAKMEFINEVSYVLRRQGSSMMRSSGRMSSRYLTALRILRRDESFKDFSKEIRWHAYALHKDVAMNSLINGHRARALRHALGAWLHSPDELRELGIFMKAMFAKHSAKQQAILKDYSSAEQIILA